MLVEKERAAEDWSKQIKLEAQREAFKSVPSGHVLFKTLFLDSRDTATPLFCPSELIMLFSRLYFGYAFVNAIITLHSHYFFKSLPFTKL